MAAIACPRCRTALPAGSMFCNACGTPLNPGLPPGAAPRQPTQSYPPQSYPNQAVGNVTQAWPAPPSQPYANGVPPGYTPTGQYAAPPEAPAKKPVALLIALLLMLTLGVGGASVYFIQRQANPLTSGTTGQAPSSPGMAQGVAPGMPASPNVASGNPTPPPGPGSPVTSGAKRPDGSVPSIIMSPGSKVPGSPSVVQVPGVRVPESPGIAQGIGPQGPGGFPVAGAPTTPPVPKDDVEFDKYLEWLRYVENERKGLRAQGETEIFNMLPSLLGGDIGAILGDPDNINEEQDFARLQQNQINKVNQIARSMQLFAQNILRTKPPVPPDCKALDRYYLAAMNEEIRQTGISLQAFARRDVGTLKQVLKQGVGAIDSNLGLANKELERAYRGRGLNQQFTISTGGTSSVLGGLVGSLGSR